MAVCFYPYMFLIVLLNRWLTACVF